MSDSAAHGVCIFGSTGSVGVNTLEVIARNRDKYRVTALGANRNVELMHEQCLRFAPDKVALADADAARELARRLGRDAPCQVLAGAEALPELVDAACESVVCGIVGAAGLHTTLAAVNAGKRVLIANKEPLVMLGAHIVSRAAESGATLLPLDSEHNAIFQCLPNARAPALQTRGVRKIFLTASGGPLLNLPVEQFARVTPQQACAHPVWRMGKKVSVDSASLMNKALELIEACALFGVDESQVEIVVHPQSVIHSMVEYVDGALLAQLGSPDMRIPIAHALAWPERIESGAARLDVTTCARLDFAAPDAARFPAINLARRAAKRGGTLPAVLNAANEVAVEAFLARRITFDKIPELVEDAMQSVAHNPRAGLAEVLAADRDAREYAREQLAFGDAALQYAQAHG